MIFSPKSKRNFFAVYDISSSSIAGAHVQKRESRESKMTVTSVSRKDFFLQDDISITRFIDSAANNLESVILSLLKADGHTPSFLQVVLAAPWYSSQTRKISYRQDSPFICTQKLINSLIETEIDNIVSEQAKKNDFFKSGYKIIEKQLSSVKLNGYSISSHLGKRATSIELFVTVSLSPKIILEKFSDIFKRHYGSKKINFATSYYANLVVYRDIKRVEDFVLIDIGEEITDVSFIKSDRMEHQNSFPLGTFGLYRMLAKEQASTLDEAVAMLESHRLGKLSTRSKKITEKSIMQFSALWQEKFQDLLKNSQFGFCLPSSILVTADSRFEKIFTEAIATDPFISFSCAYEKANIMFINYSLIISEINTSDQSTLDIPLGTAALFVERLM